MSDQNVPTSMGSFEQDFFRRDANAGSSTAEQGTMKKRLMRKYENGLATKSMDDAPLREMPSVTGFSGGLGCASMDRRGDDEISTKKQRGHRRTMDYLQNFSIQVLSSLGQFGKETTLESPPSHIGAPGFAISSSSSDAHTDTECGSHTVNNNLAAIAEAAAMSHPYQKAPFMPSSRTASNHPKSTSLYSSSAFPSSQPGHSFRSNAFQSVQPGHGHGHRVPPEGTTLPPKAKAQKPVQKSLKNTWPASMLSNVVSLAQMFIIANQQPPADNDGDSIGTGSVSSSDPHPRGHGQHFTHGHGHGGMMGHGLGPGQDLPLDSLSSRSFSTDSHDSRFVKLWSENMHLDTPGGDLLGGTTGGGGGGGGGIYNRDVMVFGHGSGGGIGATTGHHALNGLCAHPAYTTGQGFPTPLMMGGKSTVVQKTIIGQPIQQANGHTNMGAPHRGLGNVIATTHTQNTSSSSSSSSSPEGATQGTPTNPSPPASSSSVWRDCPTPVGNKISTMADQDEAQGVVGVDSIEKGMEKGPSDESESLREGEPKEDSHEAKGDGVTLS